MINRFEGRTVTYVNDKAYSAGAFISVATQEIYMAPVSVIGAAAPILMSPGGGPGEMPNTMEVKMTSGISAMIRATAERHGHDPEVVEAMIDKSKELVRDGKVLSEKGQILTLTNTEAEALYGSRKTPVESRHLRIHGGFAGSSWARPGAQFVLNRPAKRLEPGSINSAPSCSSWVLSAFTLNSRHLVSVYPVLLDS